MPSAKVARLTTFDPESVRISGWNGQMIYVFDKSHLIEEHHMKDEDSTHDAPCRPNKKQFSDMPGGCRQDYVSKIPVDGSAAGKVIETSGSDFMVPARVVQYSTSQPMSMRIAISSRIFRIRRAQTTLLAFSRMVVGCKYHLRSLLALVRFFR